MLRRIAIALMLACLALWPAVALAQAEQWKGHTNAGLSAWVKKNYTEAEKQFSAAVKQAELIGPQSRQLATSLNGLAEVFRVIAVALAVWWNALRG